MFGLCNFKIFPNNNSHDGLDIFFIKQHFIYVNVTRDGHIFESILSNKNFTKHKSAVNIHETLHIY